MKVAFFMRFGFDFLLLQTGATLSVLSAHVFRLAMAWWCLQETQSVVVFSSMIAFSVAAEVYLKPFLASFGDKFHRVKFITFCQVLVLLMISLLCGIYAAHHFHVVVVALCLISMGTMAAARDPTILGLIPDIVPKKKVSGAIASRFAINSVMVLLGPALAASLISAFSVGAALYAAACLQALSCCVFFTLIRKNSVAPAKPSSESWLAQTKAGFYAIYRVKSELYNALIVSVINFTLFPFFSVTVPFWISSELKLPVSYLGAFEVSFALGLLAGSLYLNAVIKELIGSFWNVVCGYVLLGISIIAVVIAPHIYLSIALAFFMGLAVIFISINPITLRANATPQGYRTRMNAMAAFLSTIANPFGVLITGWCIHWLGVTTFVVVSGGIVLLVVPFVIWSLHLKQALSLDEAEMKGYYEKTYPNAFGERV